ncbi:hypothetical protein [Kitasatospora cineracea]|uniref:hypothetical protein n=1 Tax=Kitasatospora cineracea TaxID=88074 RepID=UPI000F4DCBF4|nr:hypothetical protein [Kitasatospora cineracea]
MDEVGQGGVGGTERVGQRPARTERGAGVVEVVLDDGGRRGVGAGPVDVRVEAGLERRVERGVLPLCGDSMIGILPSG